MKAGQVLRAVVAAVRNLFLGFNIISLTLLTKPKQMLVYISENLFLFKNLNSRGGIKQKNVFEVLPANGKEQVIYGNLKGENWFGGISSYASDIASLCLICQIIKPKIVFEIGTLQGFTAYHFALNTEEDSKIYTMDLPKGKELDPKLKTTLIDDSKANYYLKAGDYCFSSDLDPASKIVCLYGDSAAYDYSPFHGKVDFFFIDGAHSYDYVRSDTINAMKCCHPGSVIAWHDFGRVGVNGVSKWILELSKKYEIFSIPGGSLAFMVVK